MFFISLENDFILNIFCLFALLFAFLQSVHHAVKRAISWDIFCSSTFRAKKKSVLFLFKLGKKIHSANENLDLLRDNREEKQWKLVKQRKIFKNKLYLYKQGKSFSNNKHSHLSYTLKEEDTDNKVWTRKICVWENQSLKQKNERKCTKNILCPIHKF
jgi:hypothetical protein